jgi:hypothetical protein
METLMGTNTITRSNRAMVRSACLAAALLAAGAAHLLGAAPARASASCPNVLYIGAAGSGELAANENPARYDDMGPEVNHMAEVMKARLAQRGLVLEQEPVSYPAASVGVLEPSTLEYAEILAAGPVGGPVLFARVNVEPYIASIKTGVNATVAEVTSAVKTCPGTALVLAGYSQGAIAVHQAELQLPSSVLSHVAGTLLLGDGDRVPNTAAKTVGTSPHGGEGIVTYLESYLTPFGLTKPADVPLPATTANICNDEDIVCDFNLHTLSNHKHAVAVHTSYKIPGPNGTYNYSPLLAEAAEWLANKISPGAGRITFSEGPGAGPPPPTLGPYTMTPFGPDPDTPGTQVTSVPDPAGTITFTPALEDLTVGVGWATWSNGYTGDVYFTGGGDSSTITLPSNTQAFYFYAEPNEFEDFDVRATSASGTTTGELTVYGDAGAAYFGFYVNSGAPLTSITITSPDDFAIGEFGISR